MNFYVTSGTSDYMEKLIAKHQQEPLILLHGDGNSVVLHETEKKSIFAVPRNFEVLDSKGTFEQKGFFTFYNMPIMSDDRPVFEKKVLDVIPSLGTNDAVIAYRFLRPIKAEIYSALPCPKGCSLSAGLTDTLVPIKLITEDAASDRLLNPSDITEILEIK